MPRTGIVVHLEAMDANWIEFDAQHDPDAAAEFLGWLRERAARLADGNRFGTGNDPPQALVLVEQAAAHFVLHLESCSHLQPCAGDAAARVRKVVHAKWPERWEHLEDAAIGAKVVDCTSCTPRHELREAFAAFRRESIRLCCYFDTCGLLFHDDEAKRVLLETAPLVMRDINDVLVDHCWMLVCRLTDEKGMGSRQNLTVANLNEQLRAAGLLTDGIRRAAGGLESYRGRVLTARHKLICHADKATILAGEPLGEHAIGEVEDFLRDLQAYNDEVGRAVGEGALDFRVQRGEGDAITLLQHLRVALHVRDTDEHTWWKAANKRLPE